MLGRRAGPATTGQPASGLQQQPTRHEPILPPASGAAPLGGKVGPSSRVGGSPSGTSRCGCSRRGTRPARRPRRRSGRTCPASGRQVGRRPSAGSARVPPAGRHPFHPTPGREQVAFQPAGQVPAVLQREGHLRPLASPLHQRPLPSPTSSRRCLHATRGSPDRELRLECGFVLQVFCRRHRRRVCTDRVAVVRATGGREACVLWRVYGAILMSAASSRPPKVVVPLGVVMVWAGSLMVSVASVSVPAATVIVPLAMVVCLAAGANV